MARQKSYIKLKGNLQGLCYYQLNGVDVVRKASGPSKERINSDPAFANVKANNQEFGMASKLSKAIRKGLGANTLQFKDSYMASRLSGACRKIIQKGAGQLGRREANILNNPENLIGFQLNKSVPFSQIYTAKSLVTTHQQSSVVTITIPNSSQNNCKSIPKTATHFKLTGVANTVSNYRWHQNSKIYKAEHPQQNELATTVNTQALLINANHTNIQLQMPIPINNPLATNVAITIWLGITYGQVENNQFIPFQTAKSMQCIGVV